MTDGLRDPNFLSVLAHFKAVSGMCFNVLFARSILSNVLRSAGADQGRAGATWCCATHDDTLVLQAMLIMSRWIASSFGLRKERSQRWPSSRSQYKGRYASCSSAASSAACPRDLDLMNTPHLRAPAVAGRQGRMLTQAR